MDIGQEKSLSILGMNSNNTKKTDEYDDKRIRYFIGGVRGKERLKQALHGEDIVIHAVAFK